ncbi:hypothetical protein OSB04_019222 [Centaurea solstitialis]|uniref:Uncharacterized protein n=1 Tax=Centaurea solstitialis TaxID=347529 RepID=A0AA38WE17_9ASTR|nr:hypothetical protein OSB04_019222 [Centaurea solstitialis]
MDVKTCLLNEDLKEEIYIEQPKGFVAQGKENKCEKCVYTNDTTYIYMLIIGGNDKMIRSKKDMLKSKFDMKAMGLSDVILGIKITRTQNDLVLSK